MENQQVPKDKGTKRKIDRTRPTFYLNKYSPCRAGGILPYKNREGILSLLMINYNNRYEDFGGKTEKGDKSIKETIIREATEESNGIFSPEYVKNKIKDRGLYIKSGKYLLYFIEAEDDYDPIAFGNTEIHTSMQRTVEWIPATELHKEDKNLHPRLKDNKFFDALILLQIEQMLI